MIDRDQPCLVGLGSNGPCHACRGSNFENGGGKKRWQSGSLSLGELGPVRHRLTAQTAQTARAARTAQTGDGESPRIRRRWTGCCSAIVPLLFPLDATTGARTHHHRCPGAQRPASPPRRDGQRANSGVWVGVGASSRPPSTSIDPSDTRQTSTSASTTISHRLGRLIPLSLDRNRSLLSLLKGHRRTADKTRTWPGVRNVWEHEQNKQEQRCEQLRALQL